MGEICALDWFDRLNLASPIREKNTGPVGLFDQGQALPVPGQTGVFAYEYTALHAQEGCYCIGLFRLEPHIPGLPAAGMALDALKVFKVQFIFIIHIGVLRLHLSEFLICFPRFPL